MQNRPLPDEVLTLLMQPHVNRGWISPDGRVIPVRCHEDLYVPEEGVSGYNALHRGWLMFHVFPDTEIAFTADEKPPTHEQMVALADIAERAHPAFLYYDLNAVNGTIGEMGRVDGRQESIPERLLEMA